MECRDVVEETVARIRGELPTARHAALSAHLAACGACAAESAALEETWLSLGTDSDAPVTAAFREETLELLRAETVRRRVVRPARFQRPLLLAQLAATLAAGILGYVAARWTQRPLSGTSVARVPVAPSRTIDADRSIPDFSSNPRLANVSYRPADPAGRIGVSFDVTTRYTVVGTPAEKGVSDLLAYMLTASAGTEGARGKAIDLVSQHLSQPDTAASPRIVQVLIDSLRKDKNPSVRRKAAEALAQIPPTPQIRDAFVAALQSDINPAVRMTAVDALAKAATQLRDPEAIQSLRDKATDDHESGFVRVRAASALKKINL
jgi:hypothetical protein